MRDTKVLEFVLKSGDNGVDEKMLIDKFGYTIVSELKYYDFLQQCGAKNLSITAPGRNKVINDKYQRRNYVISLLTLVITIITLLLTIYMQ